MERKLSSSLATHSCVPAQLVNSNGLNTLSKTLLSGYITFVRDFCLQILKMDFKNSRLNSCWKRQVLRRRFAGDVDLEKPVSSRLLDLRAARKAR